MNPKSVCRYNKFGYCKFSDKCHFRHNDELCNDKNCDVFKCEKRHPKICTYNRDFGRCKFTTYCRYNHEKQNDIKQNSEKIKQIEKKIQVIEDKKDDPKYQKNICAQNEQMKNLANKVENLENLLKSKDAEFENKIDMFENKLKTLLHVIEEKDVLISNMETKIQKIEENLNINVDKVKQSKPAHKVDKNVSEFQCTFCDFTSISKQGLKTHIARKHTKLEKEVYPKACDLCEKTFETSIKMKEHLKTHSYKKMIFKCEECDFFGPNELSMEVHTGKFHAEIIECGLCEFKAESLENLDAHLQTCEIFDCNKCEKRFNSFPKLKTHLDGKHKKDLQFTFIKQYKLDRKNWDTVTHSSYRAN